jgi:hypothetical protein
VHFLRQGARSNDEVLRALEALTACLKQWFALDIKAAFAMPGVYECLEAEHIKYAIRLPANQVLQNRIGYLLKRPVGRPPNELRRYYANFTYQAASWTKPRRVIGTTAAASACANMRCRWLCAQEQPIGGVRPNARKTAKSAPLPPFGLSGMTALVRAATLSCENAGK